MKDFFKLKRFHVFVCFFVLFFFFSLSLSIILFFFSLGREEIKTDSSGCFFPLIFFLFVLLVWSSFLFFFYLLFLFRLENKKQRKNFIKITKTIYMHIIIYDWNYCHHRNTMSSRYNYGRLALNLTSNPYVCWRRLTQPSDFKTISGFVCFVCYHEKGIPKIFRASRKIVTHHPVGLSDGAGEREATNND